MHRGLSLIKEEFPQGEAKHAVRYVSKKFVEFTSAQNTDACRNLSEEDTIECGNEILHESHQDLMIQVRDLRDDRLVSKSILSLRWESAV